MRVRFTPPIVFEGKTYTELTFDFDSMTGKDFVRAERTFQRLYKADKNEMRDAGNEAPLSRSDPRALADVSYVMIQKLRTPLLRATEDRSSKSLWQLTGRGTDQSVARPHPGRCGSDGAGDGGRCRILDRTAG